VSAAAPPPVGLSFPRFNVSPTQPIAVVTGGDARAVRAMRWGFPAPWLAREGKDPWRGRPLINTRSEDALSRSLWSKPTRERRCLVPATGFYEWLGRSRRRMPLLFARPDGAPLFMAGVWGAFDRDGAEVDCAAVLTRPGSAVMAGVHERMPVLLGPRAVDRWLDPSSTPAALREVMGPALDIGLAAREVSTAINSYKRDDASLMEADWSRRALTAL